MEDHSIPRLDLEEVYREVRKRLEGHAFALLPFSYTEQAGQLRIGETQVRGVGAEDLIQDALVKFFETHNKKALTKQALTNALIDEIRKNETVVSKSQELIAELRAVTAAQDEHNPDARIRRMDDERRLRHDLAELACSAKDEVERALLKRGEQMGGEEIYEAFSGNTKRAASAAQLDITETALDNLRARLGRKLKKLRVERSNKEGT